MKRRFVWILFAVVVIFCLQAPISAGKGDTVYSGLTPDDYLFHPLGTNCWLGQTNLHDLFVPDAWVYTTGNPNVILAVLDRGFDIVHPDLSGNIWVNPGEIPGNGIDDEGNGYIDDYNGCNLYNNNHSNLRDPVLTESKSGHGTHVAGIAMARADNSMGIAGIAGGWGNQKGVQMMPVKLGHSLTVQKGTQALVYALRNGAHVINCSWGGIGGSPDFETYMTPYMDKIKEFYSATIVCAAGNHYMSPLDFPARYLNTVAVTTPGYTNSMGPEMDVTAPTDAVTTDPTYFDPYDIDMVQHWGWNTCYFSTIPADVRSSYINRFGGTSASTPHVSGVVALMLSVNPGLNWQQTQRILRETAANYPDHTDWEGYGMVNARDAVNAAANTASIQVDSPNGGEIFQAGDSVWVYWNQMGSSGTMVRFSLINDDENILNINTVHEDNYDIINDGSYYWTIPADLPAGKYRLKIQSQTYDEIYDFSDIPFTIEEADPIYISHVWIDYDGFNALNPKVYHGQDAVIHWRCYNFPFFAKGNIDLMQSGNQIGRIFSQALLEPDGEHTFRWVVGDTYTGDYNIRVSYITDPSINYRSDYFNLMAPFFSNISPCSGTLPSSGTMDVGWNWEGENCGVKIQVYQSGQPVALVYEGSQVPGENLQSWNYSLPTGSGYYLHVETTGRYINYNAIGGTFSIGPATQKPDLALSHFEVYLGNGTSIGCRVTNNGNASSPTSLFQFIIRSPNTRSPTTITRYVPALSPGSYTYVGYGCRACQNSQGQYVVQAIVDPYNQIDESNETNNSLMKIVIVDSRK